MKDWYKQFESPDSNESSGFVVKRFRNPKLRKPKPEPIPRNDLARAVTKVQDYLNRIGAASRRDLQKNLYRFMDSETLDRVLYTLAEIGYLQIERSISFKTYKISPKMGKKGESK